jgi:Mg-chelatase subunit ChlD
MLNNIRMFFIIVFLGLPVTTWAVSGPSQDGTVSKKETTVQGSVPDKIGLLKEKEGIDLIFILDCSGSMKQTDPQDLRKPATELIVSLLGPKDRVGLVGFGGSAQTLISLTDNIPANQKLFSSAIQKHITSQELHTNLSEAAKKGYEEIKGSSRGTKILLLMSDGQMDLGSKEKDAAALNELFSLIPELTKANIKLYTVAFTDLSDQKLLADLAEKTRGFFQLAKTDKDLHVIFSSIFEQVKLPDTVPLEGNTFLIDKEIQDVTVLITKQGGTATRLIDPNQKELVYGNLPGNIDWQKTNVFDLITIKNPLPGRWKVQLSTKEGNKIFIVTDLVLKTSFSQNQVYPGQETTLEAWLERRDKRVGEKKFLESIFFMAHIKDPTGNHVKINLYPTETGDHPDKKGIYSNRFTFKQPGDYTIRIIVDGKTFKRELIRQVKVSSPPSSKPSSPLPQTALSKTSQPHPDGPWIKAIKKFVLINGVLLFIGGLGWLAVKWNQKRTVKKRTTTPKEPEKEEGKEGSS